MVYIIVKVVVVLIVNGRTVEAMMALATILVIMS